MTPVISVKARSPRRSLLSRGNVPFPEVVGEMKKNVVDPASIPLPAVDENEVKVLSKGTGSEDLIIHDSEEEELSPCGGEEEARPRFDFSRFVYAKA